MHRLPRAGALMLLALALHVQAQPQLLKPATPEPHGPKLQMVEPRTPDPQDFVPRTRQLLELAMRHPAANDAPGQELAGISLHPASAITSRSLQVLRQEAATFDEGLRDRTLACRMPRPPEGDYQVVVLDLSQGHEPVHVPVFLTPHGGELGYVELGLHRPGPPVMLLVAGYNGVALRVSTSPETRLAAVHLATYYPNAVLGVDPEKVTQSYHPQRDARDPVFPCRYLDAKPAEIVHRLGLQPVASETFRPGRGHQFAIGALVNVQRKPPLLGNWLDLDMPVPHQYGLAVLAHQGYVRPVKVKGQGQHGPVWGGLEVLKPFRLPEGLHGGYSVQFFVREGGAMPAGPLGHSSVYRMP
jgi:hypothetical protein